MQNLIFKGLNGEFKIAAATQYITRIKDSTKNPKIEYKSVKYQSLNFNVTSEFEMAEWMVKPQGDHSLANEKLGESCVLVFNQTEIRVPPGLNHTAPRCQDAHNRFAYAYVILQREIQVDLKYL